MSVFHIGKRVHPFGMWEPIYVGTNNEPIYDERLSWEGKMDKMTQVRSILLMFLNIIFNRLNYYVILLSV